MLVEFRVVNHRSLRDEQVFTFERADASTEGGRKTASANGAAGDHLLTAAGVYGANASGKSNLLSALAFMRDAVMSSHRRWAPDEGIPRDPFALGPARFAPSVFEAVLFIDGVRYQYGFAADDVRFVEEWLYAWPKGSQQTWFERDGDAFSFGEKLRGEKHIVKEITRPNSLFLSAAAQAGLRQLLPLWAWFRGLRTVNTHGSSRATRAALSAYRDERSFVRWFEREEASGAQRSLPLDERSSPPAPTDLFRELLRAADVGVVDVRLEPFGDVDATERPTRDARVLLQHASAELRECWLPLEEESHGTQTLFRIGPTLIDALARGGVVVIDELEASLHPLLAVRIIELFNSPTVNRHHAQLLFTTHDTTLLGRSLGGPALQRDQIWLAEKDAEGASCLYPLTDFVSRGDENVERGYLQGRYGAIPFLGDLLRSGE